MGCRNTAQAEETFTRARSEGLEGGTIEFLPLDLMSVNSVVEFSQAVIRKDVLVHVLINNGELLFSDETSDWGFCLLQLELCLASEKKRWTGSSLN